MMGVIITLLMVVLVILVIIFGPTGRIDWLFERLGGAADGVLVLIGVKESPPSLAECNPRGLETLNGGTALLDKLGITNEEQRSKASFTICGKECKVNLPEGPSSQVHVKEGHYGNFRIEERLYSERGSITTEYEGAFINKEQFNRRDRFDHEYGAWGEYNYVLKSESVDQAKLYNDLYNKIYDSFSTEELAPIKEFYDKRFTKRFILHGEPRGPLSKDPHNFLIWQDGVWIHYKSISDDSGKFGYQTRINDIQQERITHIGKDTVAAINSFGEVVDVRGRVDDGVYWWWAPAYLPDEAPARAGGYNGQSMETIAGDDDNLDFDEGEAAQLVVYFEPLGEKELARVQPTATEREELRTIIQGKTIHWNDKTYTLSLEGNDAIVLTDEQGNKPYALAFNPGVRATITGQGRAEGNVQLKHLAVQLIQITNKEALAQNTPQQLRQGETFTDPETGTSYSIQHFITTENEEEQKETNYFTKETQLQGYIGETDPSTGEIVVYVNNNKKLTKIVLKEEQTKTGNLEGFQGAEEVQLTITREGVYEIQETQIRPNEENDNDNNEEVSASIGIPVPNVHQDDIKLSREHFEEFSKIRIIKDFLERQCR